MFSCPQCPKLMQFFRRKEFIFLISLGGERCCGVEIPCFAGSTTPECRMMLELSLKARESDRTGISMSAIRGTEGKAATGYKSNESGIKIFLCSTASSSRSTKELIDSGNAWPVLHAELITAEKLLGHCWSPPGTPRNSVPIRVRWA